MEAPRPGQPWWLPPSVRREPDTSTAPLAAAPASQPDAFYQAQLAWRTEALQKLLDKREQAYEAAHLLASRRAATASADLPCESTGRGPVEFWPDELRRSPNVPSVGQPKAESKIRMETFDRLHRHEADRRARRESLHAEAQRELQRRELAMCTFTPRKEGTVDCRANTVVTPGAHTAEDRVPTRATTPRTNPASGASHRTSGSPPSSASNSGEIFQRLAASASAHAQRSYERWRCERAEREDAERSLAR